LRICLDFQLFHLLLFFQELSFFRSSQHLSALPAFFSIIELPIRVARLFILHLAVVQIGALLLPTLIFDLKVTRFDHLCLFVLIWRSELICLLSLKLFFFFDFLNVLKWTWITGTGGILVFFFVFTVSIMRPSRTAKCAGIGSVLRLKRGTFTILGFRFGSRVRLCSYIGI
jgi:hypothetical protein